MRNGEGNASDERGAAVATVAGQSDHGSRWELEIVDVHLDTSLALFHGGPFAARRRQASALLDALRAFNRPPHATRITVAGGDFNTWNGRHESAARLLADALPDASMTENAPTWRGPFGLRATLDHIFVAGASSRVNVTRLPGRFGSDHHPLLAVVDVGLN
jgi:endonuclease/exonuclease/phosphatase family metal-dependent hydrolase